MGDRPVRRAVRWVLVAGMMVVWGMVLAHGCDCGPDPATFDTDNEQYDEPE